MTPQSAAVLNHLRRRGPLTPLEALSKFGIMRLGARIWDLRSAGYEIRSDRLKVRTRNGWGHVSRYRLA